MTVIWLSILEYRHRLGRRSECQTRTELELP